MIAPAVRNLRPGTQYQPPSSGRMRSAVLLHCPGNCRTCEGRAMAKKHKKDKSEKHNVGSNGTLDRKGLRRLQVELLELQKQILAVNEQILGLADAKSGGKKSTK